MFAVIIFGLINYGVKYRMYYNYIKHGRVMGLSEKMDLKLDDVENYPKAVFEYYKEKKAYDAHIKRKEQKIAKTEDNFHKFASTRISKLRVAREARGLKSR